MHSQHIFEHEETLYKPKTPNKTAHIYNDIWGCSCGSMVNFVLIFPHYFTSSKFKRYANCRTCKVISQNFTRRNKIMHWCSIAECYNRSRNHPPSCNVESEIQVCHMWCLQGHTSTSQTPIIPIHELGILLLTNFHTFTSQLPLLVNNVRWCTINLEYLSCSWASFNLRRKIPFCRPTATLQTTTPILAIPLFCPQ